MPTLEKLLIWQAAQKLSLTLAFSTDPFTLALVGQEQNSKRRMKTLWRFMPQSRLNCIFYPPSCTAKLGRWSWRGDTCMCMFLCAGMCVCVCGGVCMCGCGCACVCVCVCACVCVWDRQTDRHWDKHACVCVCVSERETDRQTLRQTDCVTHVIPLWVCQDIHL